MVKRLGQLVDDGLDRDALRDGLLAITTARAFEDRLNEPLPMMLDSKDAIFRIGPGPGVAGGTAHFGEESGATGIVWTFPGNGVPPGGPGAHATAVLTPVYALLQEAQSWGDAKALLYAHTRREEFLRTDVRKKIRAARSRKWVRRAKSCPECIKEAPAQA